MGATLLTWSVVMLVTTSDDALAPWASNRHPSDVAKRHVQEITEGRAEYLVVQGGTMDGRNCRSPQGVWQPFQQTWESNRSVRVENVGETDVVNPWLSNGRNDFRSLDRDRGRGHRTGDDRQGEGQGPLVAGSPASLPPRRRQCELLDPVKVFNIYGYNTCGNDSICLAGQWRKAGLRVAPAGPGGALRHAGLLRWLLAPHGRRHALHLPPARQRDRRRRAGPRARSRSDPPHPYSGTPAIRTVARGTSGSPPSMCSRGEVTGDRNSGQHRLEHDATAVRGARVALGAPGPGQVSRAPASQVPRTALQWSVGIPARLHTTASGDAEPPPSSRIRRGEGRARRRRKARPASSSGRCAAPMSSSGEDWRSRGPGRSSSSPGMATPGTRSIATSTGSSRPRGPLGTGTT